jgi:protein-L-isoaspartate O-methyltransferase
MGLLHLLRVRWERLRGLDFHTAVEPEALGLDPRTVSRSTPSGNAFLAAVFADLGITPADRIMDVGCGKGSAMRVMRRFPFGRVAGIELAGGIAEIARQNFRRLRASNVEVYAGDAAEFDGYGEFNVFYFYNPFPSAIMARVLDRIFGAAAADGRELLVIYNNPVCHDLLVERGFLRVRDYPDEWGNGIRLYSNRAVPASRVARLAEEPAVTPAQQRRSSS